MPRTVLASRVLAALAASALAGAGLVVAPAFAAPVPASLQLSNNADPGTLKTGSNFQVLAASVPSPCDAAATRYRLRVKSVTATNPADQASQAPWIGVNFQGPASAGLPGPLDISASNTWQGLADREAVPLVPATFEFFLQCTNNLGTVIYEEFEGDTVTFTSPTSWVVNDVGAAPAPTTPAPTTPAPTTPAPSPTTGNPVTAQVDGRPVTGEPTVRSGAVVKLSASGFLANEGVTVTLAGTTTAPAGTPGGAVGPTQVGTVVAGADGVALFGYTVPASLAPGRYTLTLRGVESLDSAVFAFVVEAAAAPTGTTTATTTAGATATSTSTTVATTGSGGTTGGGAVLARTGVSVAGALGLAVLLLGTGTLALMTVRRRQGSHELGTSVEPR